MATLKPYIDILEKDLQLEPKSFDELPARNDPMEGLKLRLSGIIAYLLEKDFGRLLQAMYRIDIPEEDFKRILELTEPDQLADALAQRVLDRTIQKVAIREKYKNES